jgi:hypothetical protein
MTRRVMSSRRTIAAVFALFLSSACSDQAPTRPATQSVQGGAATQDQSPVGAVTWLAPLGAGSANPATFDASVALDIQICAWTGTACSGNTVAQFSTAPTAGVGTITPNTIFGDYEASWSLLNAAFTTRRTYRIRVLQGAGEIGGISVDVVRGRWALARTDGTLAPLVSANTLPIQFYIPVTQVSRTIDASGGSVALPDATRLDVPSGAIQTGSVTFRLKALGPAVAGSAGLSGGAVGNAYEFGITVATGTIFRSLSQKPTRRARMPESNLAENGEQPASTSITLVLTNAVAPTQRQSLYLDAGLAAVPGGELSTPATYEPVTKSLVVPLLPETFTDLALIAEQREAVITVAEDVVDLDQPATCHGYPAPLNLESGSLSDAGRIAVVLVHGWLANVQTRSDFIDDIRVWESGAQLLIPGPAAPGNKYFRDLLPTLTTGLANTANIYTYTYPTYRAFDEVGADLEQRLEAAFGPTGTDPGVSGIVLVGHSLGGLVARSAIRHLVTNKSPLVNKIRGLVTLATPHHGTPLVTLADQAIPASGNFGHHVSFWGLGNGANAEVGRLLLRALKAPGGQSLLNGLKNSDPDPVTEPEPIIAYAGDLFSRCSGQGLAMGQCSSSNVTDAIYRTGWESLCADSHDCHSDGIVPFTSAVPSFVPAERQRFSVPWSTYSHGQLAGASGDASIFYQQIITDIQSLARGLPAPVTGVAFGSKVCIPASFLPAAAGRWLYWLTKDDVSPGVTGGDGSISTAESKSWMSCDENFVVDLASQHLQDGSVAFLRVDDPAAVSIYAAWTWSNGVAVPKVPSTPATHGSLTVSPSSLFFDAPLTVTPPQGRQISINVDATQPWTATGGGVLQYVAWGNGPFTVSATGPSILTIGPAGGPIINGVAGGRLLVTAPGALGSPTAVPIVYAFPLSPNRTFVLQPGAESGTDAWITNFFDYGSDFGVHDAQLQVGGWGDTYYSLIRFDLTSAPLHAVTAALVLQPFARGDASTAVPMQLYQVTSNWDNNVGWFSQPTAAFIRDLPAPTVDFPYVVDVTALYNDWRTGRTANFGLELRPQANDNRFNVFRASSYLSDPNLRPRLIIVTDSP